MTSHRGLLLVAALMSAVLAACGQTPPSADSPAAATTIATPVAAQEGAAEPTAAPQADSSAEQGKTLAGYVLDTDRQPVAGAMAVALGPDGSEAQAVQSDGDGQFEFTLPLGVYAFEVRADGYQTHRKTDIDISMIDLLDVRLEKAAGAASAGMPDRYRLSHTLSYEGLLAGKTVTGSMDVRAIVNQPGQQVERTVVWSGDPFGDVDINTQVAQYQIGAEYFTVVGSDQQSCSTAAAPDPVLEPFRPEAIAQEVTEYGPALGEETINGIAATRHEFAREVAGQQRLSGVVWLAKDGGYIVKQTGTAIYESPVVRPDLSLGLIAFAMESATLSWSYELSDVGGELTVSKPAACGQQQAIGGLPLPASATGVSSSANFTSFSSAESAETLEAFYRTELEAQGWTVTSAADASVNGYGLTASNGGETYNILVMFNSGRSSVIITRQ